MMRKDLFVLTKIDHEAMPQGMRPGECPEPRACTPARQPTHYVRVRLGPEVYARLTRIAHAIEGGGYLTAARELREILQADRIPSHWPADERMR